MEATAEPEVKKRGRPKKQPKEPVQPAETKAAEPAEVPQDAKKKRKARPLSKFNLFFRDKMKNDEAIRALPHKDRAAAIGKLWREAQAS